MKFIIYVLIIIKIITIQSVFADAVFLKGKDIFLNSGNCSTCHSLKDANSIANIGPNLNEIRPVLERVYAVLMNGAGVMPSYQGILTEEEIKAVSYYVSESVNN